MKRFTAILCALSLCLALLPAPALAAEEVCFTALNDLTILELMPETMPIWEGGVLYVPADAFDINTNKGVNLGLYCSQSRNGGTVTLYNLRQMLVFDLNEGNSRNQHTGEIFADRAIIRNGYIFLPLAAVCRFLGLEYTYTHTDYGWLVRIKNDTASLSDWAFIDAAQTLMAQRLRDYRQRLAAQTPSQPPADPTPPSPPAVEPPPVNVRVCLAFRCGEGDSLGAVLDRLESAAYTGLFLFTPEELASQDGLVRRALSAGHCVGLLAEGESVEETRQMLERGNQVLSHVARAAATAVLVPGDQVQELEEEGWICWQDAISALPLEGESAADCAARLLHTIGTQERTVYLTLDDSAACAGTLATLLQRLELADYAVLAPLETRL